MQISRLFEIVILLLDKKCITAGELARHFDVSTRTIYRDVEALCQAGIPIYATQGKNGGIALVESFVLQKSLLSKEEQTEIFSALQGLNAIGINQVQGLLSKWRAVFGPGDGDWVSVDFSDWSQTKQKDIALLKEAILRKKVLRFIYFGASGQRTEREVEPIQLWFKSRAWYLKAFCRMRGGVRLFKLTRMKDVHLTDGVFTQDKVKEETPVYDHNTIRPSVDLELWIDATQAYRVYDDFDETQFKIQCDGSFRVEVSYPLDEWVIGFLMSYGPCLKVLSPADIQMEICNRIQKMTAMYE